MSDDHASGHAHHADAGDPIKDPKGWADRPAFRKWFFRALVALGLASAIAGFVPAFQKHHPHFAAETIPVFFAFWGFAAFFFIVLVGQHLRKLVGRNEGYYDERE